MRRASQITLSDADRTTLERWSRGRRTEARRVMRARIVLAAAEGKENQDIAAELNISRGAVARWRDRFAALGVAGITKDAPRGGRPPKGRQDLIRPAEVGAVENLREIAVHQKAVCRRHHIYVIPRIREFSTWAADASRATRRG